MRLKPPQIIILSFLCAIIIGTLLIKLPFAVKEGNEISLVDSLFTATSATCVTGLIVKDTGSFFSPFGKIVILTLFQIGALGIMTFSTLFAIALGRKLTIRENVVIQRALNQQKVENVKDLIKYILAITLGVELIGAALLFLRWTRTENWTLTDTLIRSVFHSISAFCNAGFCLFSTSFSKFFSDPYINIIMISLIFIGGIGFVVILDLPKLFAFRKGFTKINIQTKMVLTVSIILIVIGALSIFFMERNNVLAGATFKDRIFASLFQSFTSRTAGFNTVNIGNLLTPTLLVIVFLMFIGASPGSTGGGIKTCTFGILFATISTMLHNKDRVSVFKATIPKEVVRKALVVFFLAITWIFLSTIALLFIEQARLGNSGNYFMKILFEVTSAFGTVGLSTGITPHLSAFGKILIIVTMFVGRIGPLTAALAIALQQEKAIYTYPEERVMVG
ncbi:MAG: Trk family potassium uptake protein [Candidatus Omnitrophica bacterium]|nr:Trk family potassium uptake protein [Candidatus Omnitrophota bacterium]